MKKQSIAIVGAGLSGIILAQNFSKIADVKIFEKSRGVGGRMSSRLRGDYNFDFGTQFFIAKNPDFKKFLQNFLDSGVIKRWCGDFVEIDNYTITYQRQWLEEKNHFVPVPRMNQFCKELAQGLDISFETQVKEVRKISNKWQIFDAKDNNLGEFDWVFFAIPAPQLEVLAPRECNFYSQIKDTKMLGCYCLMLGLEQHLKLPFNMALIKNSIISWITSESSKPNRSKAPSYTILARNNWADHNIDNDIESIKAQLIEEFKKIVGNVAQQVPVIIHSDIHRWRYANISKQENKSSYFIDHNLAIGACGDWFIHGRVEASYLSAKRLFEEFSKNN